MKFPSRLLDSSLMARLLAGGVIVATIAIAGVVASPLGALLPARAVLPQTELSATALASPPLVSPFAAASAAPAAAPVDGASAASSAQTASACGGPGERACCIYDKSFPDITPACNSGLMAQLGCTTGNCGCGAPGGTASDVFFSFETCVTPPAPASSCGGPFERACCFLENGVGTQACEGNTLTILGCNGDCECGPNRHGVGATETCFPKTCGGKGQRACTIGERGLDACDAGLQAIPGCAGDCKGFDGLVSSSMCADMSEYGNIPEPTTNRVQNLANACSRAGYADLHLHLFSDTAHGGGVLAGLPYDPNGGGVNVALQQDYGTTKDMVDFNGVEQLPMGVCPYGLSSCGTDFFHKDHFLDDPVGSVGTNDGAGSNLGAPIFNGWPKWTSTTHQQAYFQWLKRAYEGGMRLTTMLAVTNSALCKGNKRLKGTDCDDSMKQIDVQIKAAKDFETWIAANDGGWFKIAYTPKEARQIITEGHLAVVLGIEVEHLFNCRFPTDQVTTNAAVPGIVESWNFNVADADLAPTCNRAAIDAALDQYYAMGVRHVFPVHNFDNAFGAPATWMSGIDFGNRIIEKHWWVTENCPAEPEGAYGFKSTVGTFGNWASYFSRFIFDFFAPLEMGAVDNGVRLLQTTTCNRWGMLPLGEALLNGLMDRGMIIDIDHMSRHALDRTLQLTGARQYPVTASHVLSFEMHKQEARHERMRTRAQLQAIANQGGMIAAMLKDDVQDTGNPFEKVTVPYPTPQGFPFPSSGPVLDDCQQSSKSFAQAYMYAVDKMGGRPVAFGSDFNGVAAHVGPRFGSDGCGGNELIIAPDRIAQRNAQYFFAGRQAIMNNPLQYPFTIPGFGRFERQVTGQRTFDFNVDGMAHIGLLPDFVAELQTVGMPQQYVDKIFQSAEEYIKMWERATAVSPSTHDDTPFEAQVNACQFFSDAAPTVIPHVTPAPNAAGWHRTPPTVSFTVTDDGTVTGTSNCHTRTVTADNSQLVITCEATDDTGKVGKGTAVVRLDQVAPSLSFGAPGPAPNVNGWHRSNVGIAYGAKDDRSGISGSPSGSVSFTTDGTGMTKSVTVTDVAGNSRTVTSPAVSIDRVAPFITRTRAPLANPASWNNTPVTVSFTCSDALSGVDFCSPPSHVTTEGVNQLRTGQVFDRAGNTASTSLGEINIDLTPPTIAGSRLPLANVHGWNNVPVAVSFSCSDALSGLVSCTAGSTVSTEAGGQSRSGGAVDRAGNTASSTVGAINLDFTPPIITGARAPLANEHGWNNVNVTASFTCSDALSGVVACPGNVVMSDEAAGQSRSGVVEDRAGNTANTSVTNVNIDKTPPAVTGARVTPANSFGWNNAMVRSSFSATDGLSGVLAPATADVDLAAEGANQIASRAFSDRAGNSASASVGGINIDLTRPTIAGSRTPLANVNGWNNTDVTVLFDCNDALSGVATCTADQTIATEGTDQSRAGQVFDRAGNEASASVAGIFIDKTAPLISGSPDRAPNVNNWYNANITVSFVCSDALSGVGSCAPTPQLISEEGAGLSRTASVMDLAFNTASATVGGINLDKTPPVVTCTNNAPSLWPPNHKMVAVQFGVGVDGGISGAQGFTLLDATSNEPDNGLGDGDTANDIQGFSFSTADITGMLRAERSGRGTGRVYSLFYEGADRAGNVTPCTTLVRVPHDQSDKR